MTTTDQLLRSIYYDVSAEGGFSSIAKLLSSARRFDKTITRTDVKDWLKKEVTYTLHYPARRRFTRNPVVASSAGELAQADLVDMQAFAGSNDNFKYLLTCIDVFSKIAFAVPLKTKHATEIVRAFKLIFNEYQPFMIQTDRGTEFRNRIVQSFLDEERVKLYFAFNQDIKASVVERFNRTLKSKMFKYFTAKGTRRYVDVIDQLVQSYNNSYHRSIKMRPIEVPSADNKSVFHNLYGVASERELITQTDEEAAFQIGDSVRLKYHVEPFDKGFYPNYQDMIFKVSNIIKRLPRTVYNIKDENNQLYPRKVYAEELQLVSPDSAYRIEAILAHRTRRGVRQVLVKWLNHDESFNSWIPESSIQDVAGI